jgi:hypothetical protein
MAFGWLTRESAHVTAVIPKQVTVGKGITVTRGQAVSALKGVPAFVAAVKHLVEGTATMADDELIGKDVLAVAAAIASTNPEAAAAVGLAAILAPLIIEGIASGVIKGDPDPIHDAQTTRNYNPGDPAARL